MLSQNGFASLTLHNIIIFRVVAQTKSSVTSNYDRFGIAWFDAILKLFKSLEKVYGSYQI